MLTRWCNFATVVDQECRRKLVVIGRMSARVSPFSQSLINVSISLASDGSCPVRNQSYTQVARLQDERDDAFREKEAALAERDAARQQVRGNWFGSEACEAARHEGAWH